MLSRSRQDYLKALYELAPGGEPAATSHLARRLGVSAPSVTNMLTRLSSERLVSHTPRGGARLQTAGPYEISRNPVYAGLLVAGAAVAVLRRRPEPLVAFAALAAVLHVKSGVEEARLRDRFGDEYAVYAARTPRLIGLPRPVAVRPAISSLLGDDAG